uniref:hypothetical protein n=1 Tax=Methanothrix sp. TaxID=90426 RepID=UPI0034E1EBBD
NVHHYEAFPIFIFHHYLVSIFSIFGYDAVRDGMSTVTGSGYAQTDRSGRDNYGFTIFRG